MNFNTLEFSGGLYTAQRDASKLPAGSYRISTNIRVQDNVVEPTPSPLDITSGLPAGDIQGGQEMGGWAIVFKQGKAYARYLLADNTIWRRLTGYSLSPLVEDIYTVVVPMAFNTFKRNNNGITDANIPQLENSFYNDQGGGIPCMIAQDGTNQPLIIHPDASGMSFICRKARSYVDWTPENPEYVPIGHQMAWDGQRLHIVLNGRFAYERKRLVGKSVNYRPLDFMVVIDSNGNKVFPEAEGDARMTSYGADFDEITNISVVGNSRPAILLCTRKNIWQMVPDFDNPRFGEPIYQPIFVGSTGVVNQYSMADYGGNTAFISQSGIRAINAVSQNQSEGKNIPLSRNISQLFPEDMAQEKAAAVSFDDLTYYAVNTRYGYGLAVFDTRLEAWVSFDTHPLLSSGVFKFLSIRGPGQRRLIALTRSHVLILNEGSTYSPGVYIGDYSDTSDATIRRQLQSTQIYLNFVDSPAEGTVSVGVFCDEKLTGTVSAGIPSACIEEVQTLPYPHAEDNSITISIQTTQALSCFRTGYWITWDSAAKLSYFAADLVANTATTDARQAARTFALIA